MLTVSVVGDWTFGSSPHPRKCSLTRLQGPNERKPSIPEGIGWTLRSASSKTMTFGTKDITSCRPKVTDDCPEAQAQRPIPSVTKDIAFVRPKVTNGCSEAQVRRPGPSGKGINFGNEGDSWLPVDGTFMAVTPGGPRRKWKPSSVVDMCVKREYVRMSDLYTSRIREKVGFVHLSPCNFTPKPAKSEL